MQIRTAGVIDAGQMGIGVAQICAWAGEGCVPTRCF